MYRYLFAGSRSYDGGVDGKDICLVCNKHDFAHAPLNGPDCGLKLLERMLHFAVGCLHIVNSTYDSFSQITSAAEVAISVQSEISGVISNSRKELRPFPVALRGLVCACPRSGCPRPELPAVFCGMRKAYFLPASGSRRPASLCPGPHLQKMLPWSRCRPASRSATDRVTDPAVQLSLTAHCEQLGSRFAVLDMPRGAKTADENAACRGPVTDRSEMHQWFFLLSPTALRRSVLQTPSLCLPGWMPR